MKVAMPELWRLMVVITVQLVLIIVMLYLLYF